MPPPGSILAGVVLKVVAADSSTKVYVNVCGHDSVGLPLTKSMDPIPSPSFLDHHGLDNLIVPISVGDPQHITRAKTDHHAEVGKLVIVDVVMHTEIIKRVVPVHAKFEMFLPKVTALALDWVTQETGIQLLKQTVKLLPGISYKDPPARSGKAEDGDDSHLSAAEKQQLEQNIRNRANALYEQLLKETSGNGGNSNAPGGDAPVSSSSGATIPDALKLPTPSSSTSSGAEQKPRRMVTEMPVDNGPIIRKGFLNNPTKRLYDEKGTSEGVLPEGAGDPLGYLPKGLRNRVQVIDTRPEAQPKQPVKPRLPFTVGSADEVSGAEFLEQLAMVDKVASSRDPDALEKMAAQLQQELVNATTAQNTASEGLATTPCVPVARTSSEVSSAPTIPPEWSENIVVDHSQTPRIITIRLGAPPSIQGMKDVDLAAEAEYIDVNNHRVVLPVAIDVESIKAKFIKSSKTLVVSGNALS